jgi:hypothetical protein
MNKYYFHFGDYYGDGHRQYVTVCLQSPKTCKEIHEIIYKINAEHPSFDSWNSGLAKQYEEPHIGNEAWDEIIGLGYPYIKFLNTLDDADYDKYDNWEAVKAVHQLSDICVNIELIIDIWLFIMNQYGAELEEVVEDNSNHFDFDYGYGCFYG